MSSSSSHEFRISRDAEQAATAWFVRLNDPACGEAERDAFEQWLDADVANRHAYAAVVQLWRRLDDPAHDLGEGGWYRQDGARRYHWAARLRPALALAASLALAVGALWWRDPGMLARAMADYAAAPGESQTVVLADGSRIYLDGDSAVSVTMNGAGRHVELLRGRVWFDVAHETERDFTVAAGGVEARVLGTAFAVERREQTTRVTVGRGRVAVANGMVGQPIELGAGDQLTMASRGTRAVPATIDAESALAWRRGLLVFDRASLGDVIAELDRQMPGRALLSDEGLRSMTLSGVFRADDPAALLGALESSLGLRATRVPGFAVIIHR